MVALVAAGLVVERPIHRVVAARTARCDSTAIGLHCVELWPLVLMYLGRQVGVVVDQQVPLTLRDRVEVTVGPRRVEPIHRFDVAGERCATAPALASACVRHPRHALPDLVKPPPLPCTADRLSSACVSSVCAVMKYLPSIPFVLVISTTGYAPNVTAGCITSATNFGTLLSCGPGNPN